MRRSLLVPAVLLLALPSLAAPTDPATPGYPAVEIVFALDTTGSMGGMIEESKRKIWSIVRALAELDPRPEIRLGILAYRDRGDDYVTRLIPLTADIDTAYVRLMRLEAGGGGDGPESVNQALHEAVTRVAWSDAPRTLRVVFLVGDAPPHMDYAQDVAYPHSCTLAVQRGIRINTIQCGLDAKTRVIWQEIAGCAGGDYFAIEQPGSSARIETPFDWQLALHARLLDETVLSYGTPEQREAHRRREEAGREIDKEAPDEAKAERARFKAGTERLVEDGDLVDDVRSGATDLESLPEESLPEELRRIPDERRRRYVEDLAAQRRGLQSEIEWFARQRDEYIETHYGAQSDSLDRRVLDSLFRAPAPTPEHD